MDAPVRLISPAASVKDLIIQSPPNFLLRSLELRSAMYSPMSARPDARARFSASAIAKAHASSSSLMIATL